MAIESVTLGDVDGRIAGERIVADADAVPFSRSAIDGYAVRAAETSRATRVRPVVIPLSGRVFAEKGELTLPLGTTVAITTGVPLPRGADAVIPHEQTEARGASVCIFARVAPGECVFPPGEDFRYGEELLASGEVIRSEKLVLLAFAGKTSVQVCKRPRVTILCTGDELVDPSAKRAHGQVRNSNATLLTGLVTEAGGESRYEGPVHDKRDVLATILGKARDGADLLVSNGGASRGERDFVKGALTEMGADFLCTEVAIRPAKPFGFAIWRGLLICVLPGNPGAAFCLFS